MAKFEEIEIGKHAFVEGDNIRYTIAAISMDHTKVYLEANAHAFGQKAGEVAHNSFKVVPIEQVQVGL